MVQWSSRVTSESSGAGPIGSAWANWSWPGCKGMVVVAGRASVCWLKQAGSGLFGSYEPLGRRLIRWSGMLEQVLGSRHRARVDVALER